MRKTVVTHLPVPSLEQKNDNIKRKSTKSV